jgi:hypothetical protein
VLREDGVWPAARLNHLPPFTPVSRVANMRFVQTHGSAHAPGARASAACLARLAPDTGAALLLLSVYPDSTHPSPCRPSLQTVSRPSTLLRRLCQSRRVSVPAGDPRLTHTGFQPFRLQPPVRHRGAAFFRASARRTPPPRFSSPVVTGNPGAALGFANCQHARLPDWPNRVRHLRTGRSPPAALHPASRRRSCVRLRADARPRGRDLHPAVCVRSRAHWHGHLARVAA